MQTLQLGSVGQDVKVWQEIIGISPDGQFGPQTLAATKSWQAAHGITADGVVGQQTWAAAGKAPEYTGTGTRVVQSTSIPKAAPKPVSITVAPVATASLFSRVKSKLPALPILLSVALLGLGATAAIYKASK